MHKNILNKKGIFLILFLTIFLYCIYCNHSEIEYECPISKVVLICERGVKEGQVGIKPGTASMPFSITGFDIASNGDIIIADTHNYRIQRFNQSGDLVKVFGGKGHGNNEFSCINDLILDKYDNIYVSDNNEIKKFDFDGNFLYKISKAGNDTLTTMPLMYFFNDTVLTVQQKYGSSSYYGFNCKDDRYLKNYKITIDKGLIDFLSSFNNVENIGFDNKNNYYAVLVKDNYRNIPIENGRVYIGVIKKTKGEYKIIKKINLKYYNDVSDLDEMFEKNYELDQFGNIY